MKKITTLLATLLSVFALLLVPVVGVQAQAEDPIVIDDPSEVTPSAEDEEAEDEVAGIPETGFAPAENKVAANLAVFLGGSALGAALGFGVLAFRKKYSQ